MGSYRLDALLGRGGMGVVYRAEDLRLGRNVALKLLPASLADDRVYRERFLRESRLAASIEHAGIVPVYEAGESGGLLYIAMRFVDGLDLAALLRREGALEPERAVALVGQLAGALDAAHARGLIHRDVKPSNVLVATDGDGEHAYLVDFGITQDSASGERLTATDEVVGTLDYMAPESLRGERVDGRVDVYALGCVLFECLTGRVPFPEPGQAAKIYAHLETKPPRPSDHRSGLPPALDAVVAKALAKDPAERWQTAAEFRAAARRALAPGAPAPRSGPGRRTVLAAAGLAVAVIVGLASLLLSDDGDGGRIVAIGENTVGVVDAGSGRLTADYDVGRPPEAIASGGGAVWVAHRQDGTVSRITPGRPEVVTVDVGGEPTALAFGGGSLWVADGRGRTVAQVAPETNRVVQRLDVGNAARAVAIAHGALWVASAVDAKVTRVDLSRSGAPRKAIPVDARPTAMAAGAGAVWVASETTGRVLRLDPRTGTPLSSIDVGNGPDALAFGAGAVWVANRTDGTVTRIDPDTEVAETRRTGREPRSVAADARGVWVANGGDGNVMHLDPETLQATRTVQVGSSPAALALIGGEVWVGTVPTAARHRGGTLQFNAEDEQPIDPLFAGTLHTLLYDGLVGYRRAGGAAGGALVGALATAVPEPGPGGRSYLFRLRPGIRFSDGSPVTPRDVRASLERVVALTTAEGNEDYSAIRGAERCSPEGCDLSAGIETDDAARTVTIHLSRRDPEFLPKLHAAFVVPAGTPMKFLQREAPPGTGPYRVVSWDPSRGGTLARNPHFRAWSPDRPAGFPDRIAISTHGGPEGDVTRVDFGTSKIADLRARYGARLHINPLSHTQLVFLNVEAAPFDDVRVRRALNYAVDRGRVADLVGSRETHVPTCQVLPPGFPGYTPACPFTLDPNPAGTWTAPDMARARRLVAASGTRGMRVEFWTTPQWEPLGPYFRSVLRRLGYRASVRSLPDLALVGDAAAGPERGRPQMGMWGWVAISAAPSTFIPPLLACGGIVNHSHFCDRDLDALMARAAEARGLESLELWRQVEAEIADQAPVIPLYNEGLGYLASPRVGNWQNHPVWGTLVEQLWVR